MTELAPVLGTFDPAESRRRVTESADTAKTKVPISPAIAIVVATEAEESRPAGAALLPRMLELDTHHVATAAEDPSRPWMDMLDIGEAEEAAKPKTVTLVDPVAGRLLFTSAETVTPWSTETALVRVPTPTALTAEVRATDQVPGRTLPRTGALH